MKQYEIQLKVAYRHSWLLAQREYNGSCWCICMCAGAKSHTHMLVVVLLVMVKSIFNMLTDFSVIFLVFVFVFFGVNFFTASPNQKRCQE